MKLNCWQAKRCGREPGGPKVAEMGPCPAATSSAFDGLNGGRNGGRICWAVSGSFCGGKVQGTFAQKMTSCLPCEVYTQIKQEEGKGFQLLAAGQRYRPAERQAIYTGPQPPPRPQHAAAPQRATAQKEG